MHEATTPANTQQATLNGQPVRSLTCCCCSNRTQGRQWHDRDTGYGLCLPCATWILRTGKHTATEMQSLYGIRGTHYAIED